MPRRKGKVTKYKKAPSAPRRFKSAYMFFSERKHKEIREQSSEQSKKMLTTDVAKRVSEAWKSLTNEEREVFHEMARQDRERYEKEKSEYKGPWKVPSSKNPTAPKRPASAFLAFSNERRREVSRENSDMSSAEVSGLLSRMWKEAPEEIRERFREEERQRREQYRRDLAEWSDKHTPHMGNEEESSALSSPNLMAAASNALAQNPAVAAAIPAQADNNNGGNNIDQSQQNNNGLPLNITYADILPLLYPGLAGLSQQLDPSQQYQLQQAGAFFGQFQNISTSTMQRPSAQTASDFTSYATFASSASGQASSSASQYQNQRDAATTAAVNALAPYLASLAQAGGGMQPAAQQQQPQQQQQLQTFEDSKMPALDNQHRKANNSQQGQGGAFPDLSQFFQFRDNSGGDDPSNNNNPPAMS